MRVILVAAAAVVLLRCSSAWAAPCVANGTNDLIVDGVTGGAQRSCELSGVRTFNTVQVINSGVLTVNAFTSGDHAATGNLELRAKSITVDATSRITAHGKGYQTLLCGDGSGPTAFPNATGSGGCAVRDSGGGGAHFGKGGRGTKDCATNGCTFPLHWEEDCGNTRVVAGNGTVSCSSQADCRNNDGLPPTNGDAFFHSIYDAEFGASGGDKGCRDGDGRDAAHITGGAGGGRIVLVGLTDAGDGAVTLNGTVDAAGRRGCGDGNDSGGGGAGGSIFVVGQRVTIGATARITVAGGLGGDTQGALDTTGECTGQQQNGTCDDCGGGGGGGIISVLSVTSDIQDPAVFDVSGALGGVCPICRGEAGGGAGELQISGGYVGEFCDGHDNDFDDRVDEGLPVLNCATTSQPSCVAGVPQDCPPDVPACVGPVNDTRARFLVIVDSSGSMLTNLAGTPTFGDGSIGHQGLDLDGNTRFDDSRLFRAKGALSTVIAAYPDIDFSLARYHQDQRINQSCQMAHQFECRSLCCSYDDPRNNTGTTQCTLNGIAVKDQSPGDECINYAGNCGPPRRGADVLVGFGKDVNQYLRWLDGKETRFVDDETVGNYCDFASGGDCELRGTGPTPLANSLAAAEDFLKPIRDCDAAAAGACRRYGVILLTDGAESCNGDPVAAAAALRSHVGVDTFVIGFSVLGSEEAQLQAIASAGSGGTRGAFLVGDEGALANALASIVSESIVSEVCNTRDDDCDGNIDEGFPTLGNDCDDGKIGACKGTGKLVCNATHDGTVCNVTTPGQPAGTEQCNGADDDCDGKVDEGLSCGTVCTPTGRDVCNGVDDDCNGAVDDNDPTVGLPCGATDMGVCELGVNACIGGRIVCVGERGPDPLGERCNGLDDDCDGNPDDAAMCPGTTACVEGGCRVACGTGEFSCPFGYECVASQGGRYCVPTPCVACKDNEVCRDNGCVDLCTGVTCGAGEQCRFGDCVNCYALGCPSGQTCAAGQCVATPCAGVDCSTCGDSGGAGPRGCSCVAGTCVPNCSDDACPTGERCTATGACAPDACAAVTCPGSQVCVDGACAADACVGKSCPRGQACLGGACVTDGCELAQCSGGTLCRVVDSSGGVRCVPDPSAKIELVTAAGGGCDGGGGGAGAALGLMALGLIVTRRRAAAGGGR